MTNQSSQPRNGKVRATFDDRQLCSYHSELKAHALRLTRDPQRADDLVQDTMLQALRFRERYSPGTNLRAWLHKILTNQFLSHVRRAKRETEVRNAIVSRRVQLVARLPTPQTSMGLMRSTLRALDTLPPSYREAVRLVDLRDMSYRQAAEQLAVPVGTVMSRLYRGRRMLAELLTTATVGPEPMDAGSLAA